MSLTGASEKMGVPEPLVQRAAAARAAAVGSTTDEILAAWAGGEAVEPAPAAEAAAPATEPSEPAEAVEPSEAAETAPAAAPAPAPTPSPTPATQPPAAEPPPRVPDPDGAPLLVGRHDSARAMLAAVVAVVLIGALTAAFAPTQAARSEVNAAVGLQPEYSDAALDGRQIYLNEGCAACHTMMVRANVADAGLGQVTRPQDVAPLAPATLGERRIGPDLAHVGDRDGIDLGSLSAFLENPGSVSLEAQHPPYGYLSDREIASLAQFLAENREP